MPISIEIEVVHDVVAQAPSGEGVTVRHPDGTVIEYVRHRPSAHELS